jgi:hypothetical protein
MTASRETMNAAQLRAEVVDILSTAIVKLLLEGRVPPVRDEKQGEGARP